RYIRDASYPFTDSQEKWLSIHGYTGRYQVVAFNTLIPHLIRPFDPVCDFVRIFGQSIVWLGIPGSCCQRFESFLHENIGFGKSNLERLQVNPSGLQLIYEVISKSPRLTDIEICLDLYDDNIDLIRIPASVFTRSGGQLSGLMITRNGPASPSIYSPLSTRRRFPDITTFDFIINRDTILNEHLIIWIASMVSEPPRNIKIPQPDSDNMPLMDSGVCNVELTRLVKIKIEGVVFKLDEWRVVIETMDLYALQQLSFANSNFSAEQLELLLDRTRKSDLELLPLRSLNIQGTDLVENGSGTLGAMLLPPRKWAPFVKIRTKKSQSFSMTS
ncbi:hypothetical protein BGX31_002235, partial [Mortierella sp. GBA43]